MIAAESGLQMQEKMRDTTIEPINESVDGK